MPPHQRGIPGVPLKIVEEGEELGVLLVALEGFPHTSQVRLSERRVLLIAL